MAVSLDDRRIGILTSSASRQGGGVFEAVVAHSDLLRRLGAEPVIFALRDEDSDRDRARLGEAETHFVEVRGPRQVGYAPTLVPALMSARLDLLHLHGIWMYPSRAGGTWACRTSRPYVISPHGMLDRWIVARGRLKKAIARLGYERRSWSAASAFQALTSREAEDIARETGPRPTTVIPNSAPPGIPPPTTMPRPVIAYIGRIHPKKNLLALVAAWAQLNNAGELPEGARLRLAGWGSDSDVAALRGAIADIGHGVEFIGPVFGEAKAGLLESARFLALPSHSEGLPMAMLESWSVGRPTLMTRECNLPAGFTAGAAIDCGYDAPSIAAALRRALTMSETEWLAMSDAAFKLAAGPFSPARISDQWAAFYTALISDRAGRP